MTIAAVNRVNKESTEQMQYTISRTFDVVNLSALFFLLGQSCTITEVVSKYERKNLPLLIILWIECDRTILLFLKNLKLATVSLENNFLQIESCFTLQLTATIKSITDSDCHSSSVPRNDNINHSFYCTSAIKHSFIL